MTTDNPFGWAHLWATGDTVTHAVAILLLAMSVASWFWILLKAWNWLRLRGSLRAMEAFWQSATLVDGLEQMRRRVPNAPVVALAEAAQQAGRHLEVRDVNRLAWGLDRSEFLTRALRQSIALSQARLERGLTVLASIGATAPFVGLFGTVWGIYHALVAVSLSGQATLDKVAGPVGEALIMTAAGIGVALPAVLGYNAFTRTNRVLLGELDAFAHDLHACLATGARIAADDEAALRVSPARTAGAAA